MERWDQTDPRITRKVMESITLKLIESQEAHVADLEKFRDGLCNCILKGCLPVDTAELLDDAIARLAKAKGERE